MGRELENQFLELTHIDLTTVHNKLKHIKDKCDNFLKNLLRAVVIDDM